MLMLLFYAGKDAYAIDAQYVEEVVPKVYIEPIPNSPSYVSGHISVRGEKVKTVDFTQLVLNRSSVEALNTRILLINFNSYRMAMIVERAVETFESEIDDLPSKSVEYCDLKKLFPSIGEGV